MLSPECMKQLTGPVMRPAGRMTQLAGRMAQLAEWVMRPAAPVMRTPALVMDYRVETRRTPGSPTPGAGRSRSTSRRKTNSSAGRPPVWAS